MSNSTSPPTSRKCSTRFSNNEISWKQVLTEFWKDFIGAVNEIKDVRVTEVLDVLDAMLGEHIYEPRADGGDPRQCPSCGTPAS